jgi:hypothetical protein
MTTFSLIRTGFQTARRHPRLVVLAWVAPLIPALILVTMIASNIGPVLNHSLFAKGILEGSAFPVFMEFRSSPADQLAPLMGAGVLVMVILSLFVQLLLSAGIVEVLAGSGPSHPFLFGVRQNTGRFFRSMLFFLVPTIIAAATAGIVFRAFTHLAKTLGNGRWDLAAVAVAPVIFLFLWAPADLAYDLSRIASVRHNHRSMVRGFFRALVVVLKNPGTFMPLYLVFLVLPLLTVAIYTAFRRPWTPGTVAAIVLLALVHQIVMAIRAFIKIAFWAAEVEVFGQSEAPEFCRPKKRIVPGPIQPDPVPQVEEPLESLFSTPNPG